MVSGSSPHTWGIHGYRVRILGRRRFIPTYVGHTPANRPATAGTAVHPHIRGAYTGTVFGYWDVDGSSPHTWGIRLQIVRQQPEQRFIPTYVGHTLEPVRKYGTGTVHPHIRGAYFIISFMVLVLFGSSPHTWGIQEPPLPPLLPPRFIPTYVGHTFSHREI